MAESKVRLKLSPPWVIYVNMVKALFGNDPEINIEYDNEIPEIYLFVDNAKKAEAISELLPTCKVYGNVELQISVIPSNDEFYGSILSNKELFEAAFEKNPAFAMAYEVKGIFDHTLTYVVFKNKVVQFFADNLNDIHGIVSTLYESIARELFEEAGLISVFYNTDVEEKLGMPLGEWP